MRSVPRPDNGPPTSVFVHLPKCGGTSVWRALASRFGDHRYLPRNPQHPSEVLGCRLLGGHFHVRAIDRLLPPTVPLFTVLRDPLDRFLSAVRYARTLPKHARLGPSQTVLRDGTFAAIVRSPAVSSDVWMMSGMLQTCGANRPHDDLVASAIRTIESERVTVGIAERMQESVDRWTDRWGVARVTVGRSNVSACETLDDMDGDSLRHLVERLGPERDLYRRACDLFDRE